MLDYKKRKDKQMSLREAVAVFLHDGDAFAVGGMGARDPIASAFEIVRQRKSQLTLVAPGVMDIGSLLIGAGCVTRYEGSYCGISIVGPDKCYRRARETGVPNHLEVEEYTNFTASLRLLAGSMQIPFIPTKSLLASDLPKYNNKIKIIDDPYGKGPIALVPASNPDVAFVHVQRADLVGNAQIYGPLVSDPTLARAAKHLILTCEEIISTEEIRQNPHMTAIPGYFVDAVIHVPFASYPLMCAGYYCCDMPFRSQFVRAGHTLEGLNAFIEEWVTGTDSWEEVMDKVGRERLERLVKMERENYVIPQTQ